MTIALAADSVRLRFGDKIALDDLSLETSAGQVTALLGENGAGKTSFIRCCTSLLIPESGAIKIFGHTPGTQEARQVIGFMPQATGAWAASTPSMLLSYLSKLYANPQSPAELMDLLGITEYQSTPYRRLSGGQQQSVNLAGALIGRPSLVFLDEPTAGLDVRARKHTWQLIEHVRDAGVAILLTTHNMQEAETLSDDIAILHEGRIRARGTAESLKAAHGSVEQAFLTLTEDDE